MNEMNNNELNTQKFTNATDCIHFHPCMRVRKIAEKMTGSRFSLTCDNTGGCKCYQKKDEETIKAETAQRQIDYSAHLDDPEFLKVKLEAFKRDKFQCQICGSMANLEIHHITYKRRGHEDVSDLVTLCADCHQKLHKAREELADPTF